jgi:outer membrane protein TolC
MEKKYKIITLGLIMGLLFVYPLKAQVNLKNTLLEIVNNNQHLKAVQKEVDRLKIEAKIGLTPADPEIEFGYMWGNPTAIGNKKDFSIRQDLDFPTVYFNKIKLGKLKANFAETIFLHEKQKVVGDILKFMVNLIYQNNKLETLYNRLKDSQKINEMTQRMLDNGEVGLLEKDKADLQLLNVQNEYELCKTKIENLKISLKAFNGNKDVSINCTNYPSFLKIVNETNHRSIYMKNNAGLLLANKEIKVKKQEISLVKSEYLPNFSVAYISENTLGQNMKGFRIGLRIPLWSKKNTVKHSKISLDQKETQLIGLKQLKEAEWSKLWMDYNTKNNRLAKMKTILNRIIPNKGLLMAFDLGELSLMEYITETTFFYNSQDAFLKLQKEMYLSLSEILKVELAI